MPDRPVRITFGSPSSNDSRDDGLVTLRVEDAMSGTVLVDLEMTPGRFWRLIQGSTRTQMAFVSSDLDRVGKMSNHESLVVPREVTDGFHREEDIKPLIEAWLAGVKPAYWDSYRLAHHNYGWAVHGTWYTEATDEEIRKYTADRLIIE